jgi:hypothetical protein
MADWLDSVRVIFPKGNTLNENSADTTDLRIRIKLEPKRSRESDISAISYEFSTHFLVYREPSKEQRSFFLKYKSNC